MDVEHIIDELRARVEALEARVCTLAVTLHELLTDDACMAASVNTLPKLEE